ncbi:hypothetical protein [Streptomyces sp. SID8352]|uniref:hypothetical protein n=1 Tax=Streptomyces sp. SID8352 TaxID=2690338 RepID=UPI0019264964|nr:hypothetical protein [Streptomyces sp. SID8352]
MRASLKRLIVCTVSSLVAAVAITVGVGAYWWVWTVWVVLAAATVWLVVQDRRA